MARKQQAESDGALVSAAKAIGTVAGKLAHAAGVTIEPEKQPSQKVPKLHKKDKTKLPRRMKKAAKKSREAVVSELVA